jgi:hypothetical protein
VISTLFLRTAAKDVHSVLTVVNGRIVHNELDGKKKKYWHRKWRQDHRLHW